MDSDRGMLHVSGLVFSILMGLNLGAPLFDPPCICPADLWPQGTTFGYDGPLLAFATCAVAVVLLPGLPVNPSPLLGYTNG